MSKKNSILKIGSTEIHPGERITLALPTPEIYTCIPMHIPIHVIHGKKEGPILLISAAMHGDEVDGIAIVQKVLKLNLLKKLQGTLIAIPVVNAFSLLSHTRDLPDHRDLESNFPGSKSGTFAARLADALNTEIFSKATHFIDLHTGSTYKNSLPHIITDINFPEALDMAKSFQSPLILHSDSKYGMMQKMHGEDKKPLLIFKGGEANRLNDKAIRMGVYGIVKLMRFLQMIPQEKSSNTSSFSKIIKNTSWILSPGSGLAKIKVKTGMSIAKNDLIATISDPFSSKQKYDIKAPFDGIILTVNKYPLVNEGDELIQIADINFSEKEATQFKPWSVEKDESIS